MTPTPTPDCLLCGHAIPVPNDQMVYYIHPDRTSTARAIVHTRCAADDIDAKRSVRVSAFAVRRCSGED